MADKDAERIKFHTDQGVVMTGLDSVALGVGIAIFVTLGVFIWGLTRQ